jgi:hypothetical protein
MTFPSIPAAQQWSYRHQRMIYVHIQGLNGILQVFPGGRKIFVSDDKGKAYERAKRRLTPDEVFMGWKHEVSK